MHHRGQIESRPARAKSPLRSDRDRPSNDRSGFVHPSSLGVGVGERVGLALVIVPPPLPIPARRTPRPLLWGAVAAPPPDIEISELTLGLR